MARHGPVRLTLPAPHDAAWTRWFLDAHAVAGLETAGDGRYARALTTAGGPDVVTLDLVSRPGSVLVTGALRRPDEDVLRRVAHLLDLGPGRDGDPGGDGAAAARRLADDPVLGAEVRAAPGVRAPGALDGWEVLLRTMVGQQISLAAARTHLARLVAALGEPVPGVLGWRLVPTPAAVAERGLQVLTGPAARVRAVVGAAAAVAAGSVDLSPGRDPAALRAELLTLRGVGAWTADYVALRVTRDPDVLLASDLVVRQGALLLGADLRDTGAWAPHRSVATMYLWRAALRARAAAPRRPPRTGNDSVPGGERPRAGSSTGEPGP